MEFISINKALSALAVSAVIAAGLMVAPSFAPEVEAGVPKPIARGHKLVVFPDKVACEDQTWPNISPACVRTYGSKSAPRQVRFVVASRTAD